MLGQGVVPSARLGLQIPCLPGERGGGGPPLGSSLGSQIPSTRGHPETYSGTPQVEREPCWELRFSQLCSSRVDLGRAFTDRQDAAGLAAAQISFALVADDFDNGRAMRMLEALGCFSDSAWAGVC